MSPGFGKSWLPGAPDPLAYKLRKAVVDPRFPRLNEQAILSGCNAYMPQSRLSSVFTEAYRHALEIIRHSGQSVLFSAHEDHKVSVIILTF